MASPVRSPTISRSPPIPEAPKEGAIARLFIAPLTFVSFLISLFIIDSRNSNLRVHQHASPAPPPSSFFGRTKAFLHQLVFKPQPYAYVRSPYPSSEKEKTKSVQAEEPWHWHTKQRHMMKMEISDAFRVRNSVVVALAVIFTGLCWVFVRAWSWVCNML